MSTDMIGVKPSTKTTLKRKVGYVDEEASVTRNKFAQMEIRKDSEKERGSGPSS